MVPHIGGSGGGGEGGLFLSTVPCCAQAASLIEINQEVVVPDEAIAPV